MGETEKNIKTTIYMQMCVTFICAGIGLGFNASRDRCKLLSV